MKDGKLNMDKLEKALRTFLNDKELNINCLAKILFHASKKGVISYEELEKVVDCDYDEVIFFAIEMKLLIPVRMSKSMAWEDRILVLKAGEKFELPNVIKYLVKEAKNSGTWDPSKAINKTCNDIKSPYLEPYIKLYYNKMAELTKILFKKAENFKINVNHIKEAAIESGLGENPVEEGIIDRLIAALKACGIISPKMSSIAEMSKMKSPIYELNPSLTYI